MRRFSAKTKQYLAGWYEIKWKIFFNNPNFWQLNSNLWSMISFGEVGSGD